MRRGWLARGPPRTPAPPSRRVQPPPCTGAPKRPRSVVKRWTDSRPLCTKFRSTCSGAPQHPEPARAWLPLETSLSLQRDANPGHGADGVSALLSTWVSGLSGRVAGEPRLGGLRATRRMFPAGFRKPQARKAQAAAGRVKTEGIAMALRWVLTHWETLAASRASLSAAGSLRPRPFPPGCPPGAPAKGVGLL